MRRQRRQEFESLLRQMCRPILPTNTHTPLKSRYYKEPLNPFSSPYTPTTHPYFSIHLISYYSSSSSSSSSSTTTSLHVTIRTLIFALWGSLENLRTSQLREELRNSSELKQQMEKLNFVRNGVIRLPPGFRFHPTDEELVVQYLRRKVFACPLPASIIPEVDTCKYDPWDLPGDSKQERYFFSTREAKYRNGNRPNRATGSGYWKATGLDKRIVMTKSNQVVGMKKTLVFYRGKPSHGCRTDWIMHEYRLVEAGAISPQQRKNSPDQTTMEDWVLCRIFLKKRNTRSEEDVVEVQQPCNNNQVANLTLTRPRFIDFMMQDKIVSNVSNQSTSTSTSSSSSGSSAITEVSSSVSDHEENGSSNSVSSYGCRNQE